MANRKKVRSDAELNEKEKYGVPSWRDAQAYPTAAEWKKLHKDKRRWEFLRRTKEYRHDWERTRTIPSPAPKPLSKFHVVRLFDGKALAAKYSMSHPVPPKIDYNNLPKGFHFIRPDIVGGNIVYPACPVPLQGNEAKNNVEKTEWEIKFAKEVEMLPPMIPHDWYHMQVWVEFDLGHGIDDQIEKAKTNLLKAAEQMKTFMEALRRPDGQYDMYDYIPQKVRAKNKRGANKNATAPEEELPIITFLRILDAKNCGRTNAQIASYMEIGDSSTVSKRYQTASRLWKTL